MRPYLDAARRNALVIAIVLLFTWGAGGIAAYIEYSTSFEADATIWTDRQSAQFASLSPQDPGFSSYITPAQQQSGLLSQLLATRSFLQEVLTRAGAGGPPPNTDERAFFDAIARRFRIDVLGTNLLRLSYRASDPRTGPAMVLAALAVRQERLDASRAAATDAAAAYYKTALSLAQDQVTAADQALSAFDLSHHAPLSTTDDYTQRQLRLALQDAQTKVTDLESRIDASSALPDILRITDALDFQIIDQPLPLVQPSGGLRPAALIAGSAGAAGVALVGMLVILGTLLRVRRMRSGAQPPAETAVASVAEPARVATTSAST